jgi:hypothetical protein
VTRKYPEDWTLSRHAIHLSPKDDELLRKMALHWEAGVGEVISNMIVRDLNYYRKYDWVKRLESKTYHEVYQEMKGGK